MKAAKLARLGAIAGGAPAAPFNPLSIAWAHAFYAEGPEFVALGLADGGVVTTWPDEAGTGDVTQATAANKPLYRAASASFNGKPIIEFDGVNDYLATSIAWASLAAPNYVWLVARTRDPNRNLANAGSFRAFCSLNHSTSSYAGIIGQDDPLSVTPSNYAHSNGSLVRTAKGADVLAHAFYMEQAAGGAFQIDGAAMATVIGARAADGALLGGAFTGAAGNFDPCDIAFLGVKDTAFTAQELTDLLTWSRAHYATP